MSSLPYDNSSPLAQMVPTGVRGGGGIATADGRLEHVEALRGIACLMVVAYHVVGNNSAHGLHVADDTAWGHLTIALDTLQMPLFAFLAGRVFSVPTDDIGRFGAGLAKKLMRLALPLLSVTILHALVVRATGMGRPVGPFDLFLTSNEHLWFLQATIVLVTVASLGRWVTRAHPTAFAVGAFAVALGVFLAAPILPFNLFSAQQAMFLAPYFFLGHLFGATSTSIGGRIERSSSPFGRAVLIAAIAVAATWLASTAPLRPLTPQVLQSVAAFALAAATAVAAMILRPRGALLEELGARSYTIYLFHIFFTAPTRMVVLKIWPEAPTVVLFVAAATVGVAVPWFLHDVVRRGRLSSLLLLGLPPRTRRDPVGERST